MQKFLNEVSSCTFVRSIKFMLVSKCRMYNKSQARANFKTLKKQGEERKKMTKKKRFY